MHQSDTDSAVLFPDIGEWREVAAVFNSSTRVLEGMKGDESVLLESPTFILPDDATIYFSLFVETIVSCGLHLSLHSSFAEVAHRAVFGSGEIVLSFRYVSTRGGKFNLLLAGYQPSSAVRVKVRLDCLKARVVAITCSSRRVVEDSTCLPHWTKWQRYVHFLCGKSRWFNAAVAAWEIHLGREEVLSLPQYMAVCPTGQCNASCGFCSVTTNRSGILKKQLPLEALDRFLAPVFGSLRLFGLEGNGEPTLYDRFDEIIFRVSSRGAAVYLISNGERLTIDQIALLLAAPTDAINFSLNAATAETHQRVMKLKGWNTVIRNISRFVRWRGDAEAPLLSVSIVVTRDNAHEIQQFLHLAEWQLKVDRILIRPLSEIANDTGVVEDLRELVPYESQINDMLDAMAEYLEFVPRRAEIVIDPTAFNAFRQEPCGVIVSPFGFESQLLAPRRADWFAESDNIQLRWRLNRLEIATPLVKSPLLARCRLIPVVAGQMVFRCRVLARKGTLQIVIVDEFGNVLGSAISDGQTAGFGSVLTIVFMAPSIGLVGIELRCDAQAIEATIDLGRMYSWPVAETREVKLPHSSHWQIDMPGTIVRWQGNELALRAQAQPGLYLYRSYKVPTLSEETISLAIQVEIERGSLGIGILSEDGNEWLVSQRFESKACLSEITFSTGLYRGFQVVLYSLTEEPLLAKINWGDNLGAPPVHKNRLIEPRQLLLPISNSWIVDSPGADIKWHGNRVQIAWTGSKSLNLLRSPKFPCPRLRTVLPQVSVRVVVKKGKLGLGFVGGKEELLASLSSFAVGEHNATITIDACGQDNLMAVLFSESSEPLEATVDWGKCLTLEMPEARNEWRGGLFDPREELTALSSRTLVDFGQQCQLVDDCADAEKKESGIDTLSKSSRILIRLMNTYMRAGIAGVIRKAAYFLARRTASHSLSGVFGVSSMRIGGMAFNALLKRRFPTARIYCQKPWTDLNNFTVDGRMDVCCITTGPSQERYALGNIFQQDFQGIWNGERMKEFRRTVNTSGKLPPCARCPMANNYRAPF